MKITAIQTSNFLGARAVDVKLTKPVTLFAGKNGAGKSSLQEAVRMALIGESVRVGLKKDYATLSTGVLEKHIGKGVFEILTEVATQRDELLELAKLVRKELVAFADELKMSSTIGGEWDGTEHEAKEEYDRLMALAAKLAEKGK